MRRIWLVALIAYAALDFANPLIPGAVNFDDDQTILAAQRPQARNAETAPLAAHLARRLEAVPLDPGDARPHMVRVPVPVRRQPPQVRPSRPPAAHPPDAADDH